MLYEPRLYRVRTGDAYELRRAILFGALMALWVFISLPVFFGRIGWHDILFTSQRIVSLQEGLGDAYPVYLFPGFSLGYGYPTGVFYPDTFLYPFAWLVRWGKLTPLRALQCYEVFRNLSAVLVSFYSFRYIFCSSRVALLGCALYTTSIWHLTNLYVRLALGEFTAMIFLPLLAAGLYDIHRSRAKSGILLMAAGATGVLRSHVITTTLAAQCAVWYVLIEWRVFLRRKNICALCGAAASIVLLNASFIAPFVSWLALIQGSAGDPAYIQPVGSSFLLLFASSYAVGGSGMSDIQMPLGVGQALLVAFCVGIVFLLIMYVGRKRKAHAAVAQDANPLRPLAVTLLFSALTLWLSTRHFPYTFLSEHIPVLWVPLGKNIQFPWRWLTIATLLLTLVAMQVLVSLWNTSDVSPSCLWFVRLGDQAWRCVALWFMIFIVFLSLRQGIIFIDRVVHDLPRAPEVSFGQTMSDDELYRLKDTHTPYKPEEMLISSSNHQAVYFTGVVRSGFQFTLRVENAGNEREWLDFPVWNYPGYRAVGENKTKLDVTDGENRRVRVFLPPRFNSTLTLRWEVPWYWDVARGVSHVSLVVLILWLCVPRWLARHWRLRGAKTLFAFLVNCRCRG